MQNETVAKINCGFCGNSADIRHAKQGKGKLYVTCDHCGQFWFNRIAGQKFLKEKAGIIAAPAPEAAPEKAQQDSTETEVLKVVNVREFLAMDFDNSPEKTEAAPENENGIGGLDL